MYVSMNSTLAVQYNGDLNLLRQMLGQLPDGGNVTLDDSLIFPLMGMMQVNDSVYALVGGVIENASQVDGVTVKAMAALQDRLVFVGSSGMGITMPYSEISSVVADCGMMSCDINISKKNGGVAKVNSILKTASNHFVNWFNSHQHQISTTPAPATTSAPTSDLDSLRKEIEELEKGLDDY